MLLLIPCPCFSAFLCLVRLARASTASSEPWPPAAAPPSAHRSLLLLQAKSQNTICASVFGSCLTGAQSMSSPISESIETLPPEQRYEDVTFLMTQLLQQQQLQLQQFQQQQQNASVSQTPSMGRVDIFSKLARLNLPTFEGTCDPVVLENWIRNIEKLLEASDYPEDHRVKIATYYLSGEADYRRTTVDEKLLAKEDFTWKELKQDMRSRFYPELVQLQKLEEFLYLHQRNMVPLELSKKFVELERFVPGLYSTEGERANRYIACLNFNIQKCLCGTIFDSFHEAVDRGNNVYNTLMKDEKLQNRRKGKGRKGTSQDQSSKKHKCGQMNSKNRNFKKRYEKSKRRGCGSPLHQS